ncbi:hypothetical protein ACOSQ3_028662 [Xanthoceras sorbifolium]
MRHSLWEMILMILPRRGLYDWRFILGISPELRVFLEALSRSNSNLSLAFLLWVLQEQVATLKAEKVALGAEKTAARERDILREQFASLKAEKVALAAEKAEAVASLNKLLDDSVAAQETMVTYCRKKRLPILKMHLEIPYKDDDPKVYANDKA